MLKTITEQFPPMKLDELINGVNNFSSFGLDNKKNFIKELINYHPVLSVELQKGSSYCRARNMKDNLSPINHVREILWPPKEKRIQGRIDSDEYEILYVAHGKDTALSELKVEHHDFDNYAIAIFDILDSKSLQVLPIGELSRVQVTGRGILLGDHSYNMVNLLNACHPNEAIRLLITDKFLWNCLVGDDGYSLTSYIAKCIFDKNSDIQAIAYPSYQLAGGVNLAIRTTNIWDFMGISAIRYVQARYLACGYFEERDQLHVKGITFSGSLVWGEYSSKDQGHKCLLEPLWTQQLTDN